MLCPSPLSLTLANTFAREREREIAAELTAPWVPFCEWVCEERERKRGRIYFKLTLSSFRGALMSTGISDSSVVSFLFSQKNLRLLKVVAKFKSRQKRSQKVTRFVAKIKPVRRNVKDFAIQVSHLNENHVGGWKTNFREKNKISFLERRREEREKKIVITWFRVDSKVFSKKTGSPFEAIFFTEICQK